MSDAVSQWIAESGVDPITGQLASDRETGHTPSTKDAVRAWLLDYAWAEDTPEEKERVVDCIMAQEGWEFVDTVADQFAGAQEEPGPAAFSEGIGFALSALYECHDGPHLPTCPHYREE